MISPRGRCLRHLPLLSLLPPPVPELGQGGIWWMVPHSVLASFQPKARITQMFKYNLTSCTRPDITLAFEFDINRLE
jgi:hypothetical protein